jgi:hypothetical protein
LKHRAIPLIRAELSPHHSVWAIKASLAVHFNSRGYLEAIVNGEARFGLDGEPAGAVADDERRHAIKRLARKHPEGDDLPLIAAVEAEAGIFHRPLPQH